MGVIIILHFRRKITIFDFTNTIMMMIMLLLSVINNKQEEALFKLLLIVGNPSIYRQILRVPYPKLHEVWGIRLSMLVYVKIVACFCLEI